MDQFRDDLNMRTRFHAADSYPPTENSDIVKTYYYWQLDKLYIGGVPINGTGSDLYLNTVLHKLLKLRPKDGCVMTTIILT